MAYRGLAMTCSSLRRVLIALTVSVCFTLLISGCLGQEIPSKVIDRGNPDVEFIPFRLYKTSPLTNSQDILSCERVKVVGVSRFTLSRFFNAIRVILVPSPVIPERLRNKIYICFHRNATLGLCECEQDDWNFIEKRSWSSLVSPYVDCYVDVKFVGELPGPISVSIEEECQGWRFVFLLVALTLMLLAPVVSSWVPFYYSSSMVIGVLLVILIILFQGSKLLPTRRKSAFYFVIYGSVVGAGSIVSRFFTTFLNSILSKFGLGDDMHLTVSILVLVGIVVLGAGMGFWVVRKFIITEEGKVDNGIALFVKWTMHFIAMSLALQSSADLPMAVGSLFCCWILAFAIRSLKWRSFMPLFKAAALPRPMWKPNYNDVALNKTEFLSRSVSPHDPRGMFRSPNNRLSSWSEPTLKDGRRRSLRKQQHFFSTFHQVEGRRRFSKKEYDESTEEYTREALAEWASSPEFTNWIVRNADRIQVYPDESSDETMETRSDSTEEDL